MQEVIKPKHRKVKMLVNSKSIKIFYINEEERRQIKTGKVKSLISNLKEGDHFESDIVVNKMNGDLRVIDGNHRIEAIMEIIKSDPKFRIEVWLAKYENLSEVQESKIRTEKIREKEREIYSKWNSGTPETTTDYIQQYFKTIPYGEQMLRQLPVSIYKTDKKMSLKMFVGNHIETKYQRRFNGMWGVAGDNAVEGLKEITTADIIMLKAFYSDMVEIFGEYYNRHPFYRTSPLSSFYRIWYDNKSIPREKFINAFKEVFAKKPHEWEQLSLTAGRNAAQFFYKLAIERLNEHRKKIQFKSDIEIKEEKAEQSVSSSNINHAPLNSEIGVKN